MSDRKILVIEDDFFFSDLIAGAMEEHDLKYDLFVRASKTDLGILYMNADGKTQLLDLSDYWLGLVDSQLKGSVLQGADLAASLSQQGLNVIAMSGMDSLNQIMIEAGALLGIRKDILWVDLLNGKLNLHEVVEAACAKKKC